MGTRNRNEAVVPDETGIWNLSFHLRGLFLPFSEPPPSGELASVSQMLQEPWGYPYVHNLKTAAMGQTAK